MKLIVSYPPHWHGKLKVAKLHLNFIIALLPAVIFALYNYGFFAARVITLAVSTAVLSDILIRKLFRKTVTALDGSACLIGLLFALILPATAPYWLVIIGSFLCVFVGKEIFGGLGSNPLNPVLVGWAILKISWPAYLNFNMVMAGFDLDFNFRYPLTILKKGGTEFISDFNLLDLFLGKQVGGLGAAAIFLLVIGGIYLLYSKTITWEIPLFFTLGVIILGFVFWLSNPQTYATPWFHLLTGNVMIGIFFLSADYSSTPFSTAGKIIFGLGCGFMTIILRSWSNYPDGVLFAILIMNLFTPLLDKIKGKPKSLEIFNMERRLS
jgi:electron transport complex protein RnfD